MRPVLMPVVSRLPAVALAALSLWSTQASAVALISDNFDSYSYALSTQVVGPWLTSASPAAAGGANGGVDVVGSGTPYDFYPGNGQYVDLSGVAGPTFFYNIGNQNPLISLGYTGTVNVTIEFDLGQNPGGAAGQPVDVYYGGALGSLINVGTFSSTTALTHHTVTFTGVLGSLPPLNNPVVIGFLVNTNDGQGPVLDNVLVDISPVPEASTTAMLLAGMVAMGWLARRRRAD